MTTIKIILLTLTLLLSSCITIYRQPIEKISVDSDQKTEPIEISVLDPISDEYVYSPVQEKLSNIEKTKIKQILLKNISEDCQKKKNFKSLDVTFITEYRSDESCWIYNLCWFVWPAIIHGSHYIQISVNGDKMNLYSPSKRYYFDGYAHVLLIPTLVAKPFDHRKEHAWEALADSASKEICQGRQL